MLSTPTTAEQINMWRAAKSESEHLEFKEAKNQFDFDTLLSYCVAMANERGGVLLLGIANRPPRPVVGTKAYLNIVKITEDIFNKIHFRVDVEEVQHPEGRVLVFHIPSRPIGHPYQLDGAYLMRSGESTVAMTPDQLRQIIAEGASNRRNVVVALVLVVILGIFSWLWVKYQEAEPQFHGTEEKLFAADILYALPNRDNLNRPIFWVVSKPSKLVFPVDVFLKIRVVNLQKNKASLDSIRIEIKGTTDWIKFKAIPMQGMTVVVGNLATARECMVFPADIGEVFKSEIEPGGKAEATGFFGSSGQPFMIPEPPKFRITLRDTVGRLTVIETSGVPPSDEPGLDQTVFKTFGQLEDFSSFRQQRF